MSSLSTTLEFWSVSAGGFQVSSQHLLDPGSCVVVISSCEESPTYPGGAVVEFVAPLERLAVREISARYLSEDARVQVTDLLHADKSMRMIDTLLARSSSTISREVSRNSIGREYYRPFDAQRHAIVLVHCGRRVATTSEASPADQAFT